MLRIMKLPAALALFAVAASAQSFDVASVKLTTNIRTGYGYEKIVARPGNVAMSNVRLRAMIKWAYDVKDYQISGPSWLGLPGWLGADVARYEVQAKAPAGYARRDAAPDAPEGVGGSLQ